MATMNISLPAALRAWVEERVNEGSYGTASEYFRELVRVDRQKRAEQLLELHLLEGLESGDPIPLTRTFIDRKRKDLLARRRPAKSTKRSRQ